MMMKSCEYCDSDLIVPYKSWSVRRFCNKKCYDQSRVGRVMPWQNTTGLRRGHVPGEFKQSPEEIERMRLRMLGISPANKGKPSAIRGEKHWNWQGGKTLERDAARKSLEYKSWRRTVFGRDNYTCQDCGERGATLHAHHINPWSLFPELRFDPSNGKTLCIDCHKQTPTYLNGALRAAK